MSNPILKSSLAIWRNYPSLYRLVGSYCVQCQKSFYPKRLVCPFCHHRELLDKRFSGKGKIVNVEQNNIPQITVIGYRNLTARYMAIIQLIEGPFTIGELVDVGGIKPQAGMPVYSELRRLARDSNQTWQYGIKFIIRDVSNEA